MKEKCKNNQTSKVCPPENWTTNHTKNTMSHRFNNGYTVTVYWDLRKAYKQLNEKIDSFSIEDLGVEEYHTILLNINNL